MSSAVQCFYLHGNFFVLHKEICPSGGKIQGNKIKKEIWQGNLNIPAIIMQLLK